MKVLLVAVSSVSELSIATPDKYESLDIGHYPPLGLMYLASYLKKNSGHVPEIIDMGAEGLSASDVVSAVESRKPLVAGFYTTIFNIDRVYDIVRLLKSRVPGIIIVLGGPRTDLFQEETASLAGVDFAVSGEGEITFLELLNCIEQKCDLSQVRGIAYKDNGVVKQNERRPLIDDLDTLPFPDRKMIDYRKYYSVIGKNRISTTLMNSRGCPFRCNFCFIQYGGKYRSRTIENVLAEIDECVKLGIKEFFIFDEIFTVNKSRVLEFCRALKERKYKIIFDIRSRVDTVDKDVLNALKRVGCTRIQYGIESGSDEVLKLMNKGITVQKTREVIKLTKEAGMEILLDFIIGYPGENIEQIRQTIQFAKELNTDYVQFGIVTLFPGTQIYRDALKNGFVKEDYWRNVAKDPSQAIDPPFASDVFTRAELEKFVSDAYIQYYFRAKYILKMLLKTRSPVQLMRQIKAAYHLLLGK